MSQSTMRSSQSKRTRRVFDKSKSFMREVERMGLEGIDADNAIQATVNASQIASVCKCFGH